VQGIRATIHFDCDVEHPKTTGVTDGYQPHHKFEWADFLTSGIHHYKDQRRHYAGETVDAVIEFPFWSHFGDQVSVGDHFEIREASRLVGHGVVNEIMFDATVM